MISKGAVKYAGNGLLCRPEGQTVRTLLELAPLDIAEATYLFDTNHFKIRK